VRPGRRATLVVRWMGPDVRLLQIEDQPTATDVVVREPEPLAQEDAQRLGLGCMEHRVHTFDHGGLHAGWVRQAVWGLFGLHNITSIVPCYYARDESARGDGSPPGASPHIKPDSFFSGCMTGTG
jgi:hypothetical protein